jgi:type IV pilus assembly protein PilX
MKKFSESRVRGIPAIGRQRGVVLFIALIAMVVLSLAGVALIRAVDTSGSVAGNLAFREASISAVNLAIENATSALFIAKKVTNLNANDTANNYYASLQAGEKPNGVPAVLDGTYSQMQSVYPFGYATYPITKAEVRMVIERICNAAGAPNIQICDELPPKVSVAKTSMKTVGPTIPPIPLYRVTVRVDLPNTNTVTYAQAIIK